MKTTHGLVLAALLSTMAACNAPSSDKEAATSSDQALAAAPASSGIEMHINWMARSEISDALGGVGDSDPKMTDVIVPGVLRIQHQYSVAALRLEATSWALATDLPVENAPWSLHSSLGVTFPRDFVQSSQAEQDASAAAAEKLFNALVHATETTTEVVHGVNETTRASARKTLSCTKTTEADRPTRFRCTIAGVISVGGPGLFWRQN
jgi:hypothetical protein